MRLAIHTVTAFLLCAFSLSAQTVDEVIAKGIQARGGVAKIEAIHSLQITGYSEFAGVQANFTQVFKRPMQIRLDSTIQGVTLTQAYDGANGWQIIPFTGQNTPGPMSDVDLKRCQEEADFEGPLVNYKQKGNTVQLMGKEKVDGTDAYQLQITLNNGDVRDLYLDATNFLALKMVGKIVVQGKPIAIETHFSDYRGVEGVKFSFSSTVHAVDSQTPDQKITISKVELNVPVEDSVFKMPAAASAPAPEKKPASP